MKDVRLPEFRDPLPEVHDAEQAWAWELRTHWAKRRRVTLTLSDRCMIPSVTGLVDRVAVTGAFAIVSGWHVPLADVTGVFRPHFHQREAEKPR